ncbi:hypothetical protein DBR00_15070 [Pseudomonas sp. HMWF032]|nr:hypothetical protein DBR00_15070 [Pseudomonas sp. HMWF032]PTT84562.1 hypothetical protein DBR41_07195 [Pseudomonas sp. HMWF010]
MSRSSSLNQPNARHFGGRFAIWPVGEAGRHPALATTWHLCAPRFPPAAFHATIIPYRHAPPRRVRAPATP